MAKTETEPAGTAGSQFFVVTGADAGLMPDYAIVGEVTEGMETVDKIGALRRRRRPAEQPVLAPDRHRLRDVMARVAAVVLAAGEASRFGAPKQRLLLPAVLERLGRAGVDEIVVVAGAYELEPPAGVRGRRLLPTGSAAQAHRFAADWPR